jgi:Tfp pilus assembly protein PilN
LWLTSMQQTGGDVTMEGRSTTLVALSDFVTNLGTTPFFKKPIEIVDSQIDGQQQQASGPDLIKFTVKAQLLNAPSGSGGAAAGR